MTEQELIYFDLGYIPEQYPWLYPSLYPDYSEPLPSWPVESSEPSEVSAPSSVQEVISVDELLERFQGGADESQESAVQEGSLVPIDPGDVVAAELDPGTLAIIEVIKHVKDELIQIGDEVTEMQLSMDTHPMLTTPFEHYTVTEGLLLLLLLAAFLSACARMLRGGLSWLRS